MLRTPAPLIGALGSTMSVQRQPIDCNGAPVAVGSHVRIIDLTGTWLDALPKDEQDQVRSMVGEVFEVEEVDKYDCPVVSKTWPPEPDGTITAHSVALEPHEFVRVDRRE